MIGSKKFLFKFIPVLLLGALISCSGGPRKKREFVVVSVEVDIDLASRDNLQSEWENHPGWRHNLREVGSNHPAFVHYPEIRFAQGDQIIMKRNRRGVSFELAVTPLY